MCKVPLHRYRAQMREYPIRAKGPHHRRLKFQEQSLLLHSLSPGLLWKSRRKRQSAQMLKGPICARPSPDHHLGTRGSMQIPLPLKPAQKRTARICAPTSLVHQGCIPSCRDHMRNTIDQCVASFISFHDLSNHSGLVYPKSFYQAYQQSRVPTGHTSSQGKGLKPVCGEEQTKAGQ